MRKWLLEKKWDLLIWIASSMFLFWFLKPLLSDSITAGWDTTPHFYLFTKMVSYLEMGRITGYDSLWFGGFPVFKFYGPLPYMLMSVPYFATAGKIGMAFSFNLFLFTLPFLFLSSVYYTARIWFRKSSGCAAMLFATFFLTAVKDKDYVGVGINSIINVGLFTSFFAICLMVFFIGLIEKQRSKPQTKNIIYGGVLLTMLLLTHHMTTLFTLLLLVIFTLINWKKFWKSAVVMGLISLVLSSFWLIPFLKGLWLSSGQKLGMMGVSDPLFVLYDFSAYFGEHPISLMISTISVILLLGCGITGLIICMKNKKEFWPLAFLFTLIVLPRQYLSSYIDLPVHYYRYTSHIYVLNIFLATAGFIYILGRIKNFKTGPRQICRGVIIGLATVAFLVSYIDQLNLSTNPRNSKHKYSFAEYPDADAAQKVLEYMGGLNIKNKVIVPTLSSFQDSIGSPHFFGTFLPLKYKIPILPGLLAESSLTTQFVMPVISTLGNSLNWGNTVLLGDYGFSSQDLDSMISRLGLYNVQYLLLTRDAAEIVLENTKKKSLSIKNEIGDFNLLELSDYRPLIEATNYKPFLYVDKGGLSFLNFCKEWFKVPGMFEMPVIYSNKNLANLPKEETSQMSGYIVSFPNNTKISSGEYEYWLGTGKNVIFLNAFPDEGLAKIDEKIKFMGEFNRNLGNENLQKWLKEFTKTKISRTTISPDLQEDMALKFSNNGGTLINYSYFPDWQSRDNSQTVYWATPTMMWVFAKGETELEYD